MKIITFLTVFLLSLNFNLKSEAQVQDALDFDGVNDNASPPHTSSLNLNQDFTISAWVYPKALTQQYFTGKIDEIRIWNTTRTGNYLIKVVTDTKILTQKIVIR